MTTYEKSLSTTEYFLVDQERDNGQIYTTYYQASDEAIKAAEDDWNHLTIFEQHHNTVTAWRVIHENIYPDYLDDDRPWWESTIDRQDLLIKFPVDQND